MAHRKMTSHAKRGNPKGFPQAFCRSFWYALILSNLVTFMVSRHGQLISSGGSWSPLTLVPLSLSTKSYNLAFEQSLGFFDDISDHAWAEIYHRQHHATPHYMNSESPDENALVFSTKRGAYSTAWWQYSNWIPSFSCPRLRKIGGRGDGPKWICDVDRIGKVAKLRQQQRTRNQVSSSQGSECLVYSIGSNGDFKFENAIIDTLGPICEVHIFDPGNFAKAGLAEKNIFYHQWGLNSSYYPYKFKKEGDWELLTFQETQKKLGHENRTIDIFKIDCEGCEWTTYLDWIGADIRQILLETHRIPVFNATLSSDSSTNTPLMNASDFFNAFEKNDFVLYNREVNAHLAWGECYEWSFLKLASAFFKAPSE